MPSENDELFAAFITESNESLADMENDFLAIEESGADIDSDLVNKVFRGIHSMKGASGFLGLESIGSLAHEMENVLNLIRAEELVPTSQVVDALLRGADALRGMINNIDSSNDVDVSEYVRALKKVVSAEAAPTTQEILDREVDIELPTGELAFMMVPLQSLVSRQKQGHNILALEVDFIADVQEKDLTPLQFLKKFYEVGELIDSYISTAGIGSLDDELPDALTFMILAGTTMSREDLAKQLDLPQERVHHIASSSNTEWGPTGPLLSTPEPAAVQPTEPVEPQAPPAELQIPDVVEEPQPVVDSMEEEFEKMPSASTPPPAPTPAPVPPAQSFTPAPSPQPVASSNQNDDSSKSASGSSSAVETSLRVSVKVLDTLMNLAGELVLGRNQLMQVVNTAESRGVDTVAARIDQVTSELQDAIMQTRMQQIGAVFNKFPRIVRDLSAKLGKQCELIIEGREVELDKAIIESIGDPLTHLVRNSVDHGIETPDIRSARSKDATGKIVLRAFHEAGKVNISIKDDGGGIDAAKLRNSAVNKGLITLEQAREMNDRDAVRLIFHPGFSTAEQVTDLSGRGVGMDVVKTNIDKLGGTVDVETEIGVGTTINVKLPLTLAIIPSLVVRCGDGSFAIPQVSIRELVRVKAHEVSQRIERVKEAEVLRLRGSLLPLVRLTKVLNLPSMYRDVVTEELQESQREHLSDRRKEHREKMPSSEEKRSGKERRSSTSAGALNIIVVETGRMQYGVVVDALEDSEEIVVKPLGRHLKDCECLAGATILGDGTVALILDVAGVAAYTQLAGREDEAAMTTTTTQDTSEEMQSVLLMSNHPDEQFAVPMPLISRIERIRSDQIDSVGGQDVLQYRGVSLSLLSLEDLITAQAREQHKTLYVIVFNITGREIGLVAPQLVDIRMVPAEIDTLTFDEKGVMGSLIVNEKTTRLLDIYSLAEIVHPEWFKKTQAEQTEVEESGDILLAEDSSFFRRQLVASLEKEGYTVVGCEDGLEAWNTLQDPEKKFSLVITDIEMPNMDGLELAKKIKTDPMFAHLPIVAVTSLASEDDIQRGMEAGIEDYQIKLDREKLLGSVSRLLSEAKLRAGTRGGAATPATTGARS